MALDKIAFLPFGMLIDQWRWDVFVGKSSRRTTTRPGGSCARSTRASRRRCARSERTSIPARSTTCPATRRTRATSSRASCSSSSTGRCARRPATRARCTSARSTATRRPASACEMLALGASKPWPETLEELTGSADGRLGDPRVLRAAMAGSTNRTRARPAAG